MKLELNRQTDYSDEAFLNEIRRVAKLVDGNLTKTKFNSNSRYSASTIEKRFNGWLFALKKAGLGESYWHTNNIKISTKEILAELIKVSVLLQTNSFTINQFADNSTMTKYVFKGDNGFNKLMKLAGLETPKISRKYNDDDCFENLLKVWSFYGRQPNYDEMKNEPSSVGPKAYVLRWGSWTNALLTFLDKINSDFPDLPKENDIKENNKEVKNSIKSTPEDKRDIPIGLRFKILKRDYYKCVICGRSPATNIGIELHVDHIFPFSKGGKTQFDNLRTLCNECNIGKSDIIE